MKLKKLLSIMFFALAIVVSSTLFVACGKKYDMSKVTFVDKTVAYTGEAQTIEIGGSLPDGVSVAYDYFKNEVSDENKLEAAPKDVGIYKVVAKFTCEDQKVKIQDKVATLTIVYDTSLVTFADKTSPYNGKAQTLEIGGSLPAGISVSYTYYKNSVASGNKLSSAPTDAGVYKVVAKFSSDEADLVFEDKTATLTITKASSLSVVLGATQHVVNRDYVDLDEPVTFKKGQDGTFSHEYDGREYGIEVVDANALVDDLNFAFFTSREAAESGSALSGEIGNVIKNVGVTVWVKVEIDPTSDSYKNFDGTTSLITSLTITKRMVAISSAAELDLLRTEMTTVDANILYNTRYYLTQDINYGGKVWVTLGAANQRENWVGEFDGQNHKIYNFKITEESLGTTDVENASNGLSFGFWGFLKDAYIHDVTFDSFQVNVDANKINGYVAIHSSANPICFGIVAGRTRYGTVLGTHFENILVQNGDVKIITKGGFYGAMIGEEYAGQGGADVNEGKGQDTDNGIAIIRKNLDVKNVKIQAVTDTTSEYGRLSIGGLIGELMFDTHLLEDCDVEGVTLINGDASVKDIENVMIANIGGIVGLEYSTWQKSTFRNCTIHNFRLESWTATDKSDMASYTAWSMYNIGQDASGTGGDWIGCEASNDNDTDYGIFRHTWDEASSSWNVSSSESWRELLIKGAGDMSSFIKEDKTQKN